MYRKGISSSVPGRCAEGQGEDGHDRAARRLAVPDAGRPRRHGRTDRPREFELPPDPDGEERTGLLHRHRLGEVAGWSMSVPLRTAMWYASSWSGTTSRIGRVYRPQEGR